MYFLEAIALISVAVLAESHGAANEKEKDPRSHNKEMNDTNEKVFQFPRLSEYLEKGYHIFTVIVIQ